MYLNQLQMKNNPGQMMLNFRLDMHGFAQINSVVQHIQFAHNSFGLHMHAGPSMGKQTELVEMKNDLVVSITRKVPPTCFASEHAIQCMLIEAYYTSNHPEGCSL